MRLVNVDPAIPDRDEAAALWCLDLADGNLSPERQDAFDRWHADPANAEAFQRAASAWDVVELLGGAPDIVRMRSEALNAYRHATLRRGRTPACWRTSLWRACAVVAAAAITVLIGWSVLSGANDFRTEIGERRVAMLEDGSRLSLDADSEVKVQFDARRRTLVLIRGRARFDVAHNPLRPFTVAVGDKMVVATGTAFSVERLNSEAQVALFEGHVAVLDTVGKPVRLAGRSAGALLVPGGELTVPIAHDGPVTLNRPDTDEAARWQQGRLGFDDVALPIAVERMNRYLNEPLVVGNSDAGRVRVSGVFDGGDASGFLDALRQLSGVRAERRAGKVFLTKG